MRTPRVMLVALICFSLSLVGAVCVFNYFHRTATLTIDFSLADQKSLTASLDHKPFELRGLSHTYTIAAGHHSLNINKPGYDQFVVNFDAINGQNTLITANLHRKLDTAIGDWHQVKNGEAVAPNAVISKAVYFYQNTWAFLIINQAGDSSFAVVRYDDAGQSWMLSLGPGTFFQPNDLKGLPLLVKNYMQDNGYAGDST